MAWVRNKWLLVAGLLFVVLNTYAAIKYEWPILSLLPIGVLAVHQAIYRPKRILLFVIFATPLSFNFEELKLGGIGFYFPTEPMLFGLLLLYALSFVAGRNEDKRLWKHPISKAVIFSLVWIGITSFTSTMPVVSLKFLLARLWFVMVIFYMANHMLKDHSFREKFIWFYVGALTIVIFYTIGVHASEGFSEDAAHWAMNPFYKDHTSYGAILAMFYPWLLITLFSPRYTGWKRTAIFGLFAIFTLAIILSYTRAAWVSLGIAAFVFAVMRLRIHFKWLAMLGVIMIGLLFAFQEKLLLTLEQNRQDSSDDFGEHVESITNISSDASNLERLNRWSSAWRMFKDRPVFGFGPGTYMFKYGTYQLSSEKTIISTNLGDMGNAHSEYLGPLSESGVLGIVYMFVLVGVTFTQGVKLYYKLENPRDRRMLMAVILGLTTYFAHGFLNNYLDTDKASIPVWGFLSIIVALDLYAKKYNSLEAKGE